MHQDRKAQNELYDLLYNPLMSIATRYTKDWEEAKSNVNMGFLTIILKLENFPQGGSIPFLAWARRVMINSVINEYRKGNKERKLGVVYNDYSDYQNVIADLSIEAYSEDLTYETVSEMLKKLPNMSYTVFNLHALDGYSHEEISTMLDITQSTSRWYLMNARKLLQEQLLKKKSINKASSAS